MFLPIVILDHDGKLQIRKVDLLQIAFRLQLDESWSFSFFHKRTGIPRSRIRALACCTVYSP